MTRRILHLYADTGVEDEVLAGFGDVVRVGIDPDPNPYSRVVRGDARDPPIAGTFDLAVVHYPCQRWSRATENGGGDPEEWPDDLDEARDVAREYADDYILENVPEAPLEDPVVLTGKKFGLPIHYPRAFETTFYVAEPDGRATHLPDVGGLAEQGTTGKAWVGSNDEWRLAKGYNYEWPARGLKRHAVPAAYLRHLLYYWLAARAGDRPDVEQSKLGDVAADGGRP